MTSRIGNPDTAADIELRECLSRRPPSCFVMTAGAGSGKTTSLIKALHYLTHTYGKDLRKNGQQVACVTFTKGAVHEICSDLSDESLLHVSTIHSFLWTLVRPFQKDIHAWVAEVLRDRLVEAHDRLIKPGARATTKEKASQDIERLESQQRKLLRFIRYTYGTGSNYSQGILGHDDILKIGPSFIMDYPLMAKLVTRRFPYVLVDESQDTNPRVVEAFRHLAKSSDTCCIGFFGDAMQKIYTSGAGAIEPDQRWSVITKPENFRCPPKVLRVINRIRADDDGLDQEAGARKMPSEGDGEGGSARLFVVPSASREKALAEVRKWLAAANADPLWIDGPESDVRVLVLMHRMAASRHGFIDLYNALDEKDAPRLKEGLLDGTAWPIRPFLTFLLPLAEAATAKDDFAVMSLLRANCLALKSQNLVSVEVSSVLASLRLAVNQLTKLFAEDGHTVREVLSLARNAGLCSLDERILTCLDVVENGSELAAEEGAVLRLFSTPVRQLSAYRSYIEDLSPFSTHQAVKGAEFNRVLVLIDEEESAAHFHFSYEKYFGIKSLSDRDEANISEGADSVVGRTRRLFYVCCSRALRDLAVVVCVPDPASAAAAIRSQGHFDDEDVIVWSAL